MIAFAANSLLCRIALNNDLIDPASFTVIRLVSGAIMLSALSLKAQTFQHIVRALPSKSSLIAGISLFAYAALFSFAYVQLATGTGALLLFGAVQLTLIAYSFSQGHRFQSTEILGITTSIIGFIFLMLPSSEQPALVSALLMTLAGISWAVFTLLGKATQSPLSIVTQGFIIASMLSVGLIPIFMSSIHLELQGLLLAIASGALTSGLGYYLWYQTLLKLSTLQASVSQLSVPAIATILGATVAAEAISQRTGLLTLVILLGIGITFLRKRA
ncbi:DMT family transporter [Vibrio sp. FNV 38]|nr:DMT family transporter [Vibrio sp. FNV 38]